MITLTHIDGTTWTSSKKGRPPNWVLQHPEYITFKATSKVETTVVLPTSEYRYWKYIGLNCSEDEVKTPVSVTCFVCAHNPIEAMKEVNKSFKFPVTAIEFQTMWKELPADSFKITTVGFYELKNGEWIARTESSLKRLQKAT